jgi:type VI secretion system protein ImpA
MTSLDVNALLQEIDGSAPCGANLEYDPAFLELELNVQGKPEVQYGTTITPPVPPDWKIIKQEALALLNRSRDLRVATPLVRSLLALHGIPGLSDGLALIDRLLDERWDSVHPQLDPDDGLDPTLRINSIAALADRASVLQELMEAEFITLPGLGALSLRQLDYASGELATPKGQTALALSSIEAALADVNPSSLKSAMLALERGAESARRIEASVVRRAGAAQALNLEPLIGALQRMYGMLERHARRETALVPTRVEPRTDAPALVEAPAAASGVITNRAEVVRMLERILAYYQQHEPSSPIPMLLERAKRLAPKNFLEIMEDLAPDSINQLLVIRGRQQT